MNTSRQGNCFVHRLNQLFVISVLLGFNFNFVALTSANDRAIATDLNNNPITINNNECKWDYDNSTNSTICRLSTIDTTYSGDVLQDARDARKLKISCDDDTTTSLRESQLPKNIFRDLPSVTSLVIESCKFAKLPENSFDGLMGLKSLTVNLRISQWNASTHILELHRNTMKGLKQLTRLELIDANIRVIPDGFYCPLTNLKELSLSNNRIRSIENIGFSADENMDCSFLKEITTLNLSGNELQVISEDGWSVSKLRRLQHLHLQHNNLTDLPKFMLRELKSLQTLNLSYNSIDEIPLGFFDHSKELRFLYLQNNQIFQLPVGAFHHLENLLELDFSTNLLTSHNINKETFVKLNRLVILNLAHNSLTRLDADTFHGLFYLQELNLRNNSIGYIEENTFVPVYNLYQLNLAENRLHTLTENMFNGLAVLSKLVLNNNLINIVDRKVFKVFSTSLKELDMSSNQLTETPEALGELVVLRTLDLGENQIVKFSGSAFRNLQQLTGLRLIDNKIDNITRGMFSSLPSLNVLNIAKNEIRSIEHGSFDANREIEAIRLDGNFVSDINGIFTSLSSLQWLNIAENHLSWFDYAFIPKNLKYLDIRSNYIESLQNYYELQDDIRVTQLDASHNRITEIGAMNVPNSVELLFINNNLISTIESRTFIDKTNLTRVDLYSNLLQKLQLDHLRIAPSASISRLAENRPLPQFYLAGNLFECDCSMEWLMRINNFTSRQHPRIMDLANVECVMPYSRNTPIKTIENIDITDFICPYKKHCFSLCNCCDQDNCECDMTCPKDCSCYHDDAWMTNVVDCSSRQQDQTKIPTKIPSDVTELYLDGNRFQQLSSSMFWNKKFNKLRQLFLNASEIEEIKIGTFAGFSKLQTLHLHDNMLRTLHGHEFEQLTTLRELNLQNNQLTFIGNQTFVLLRYLQVLRIDGNQLTNVQLWQLLSSSTIPSKIIGNSKQLKRISIGRNPWSCDCKFLQGMTQFLSDNVLIIYDIRDIYCVDDRSLKRALDFNLTSVCSEYYLSSFNAGHFVSFREYMPIFITLLTTICLLVFLVILLIFREPLKMCMFSHYGFFRTPCDELEKLYDAIIFHSAKDSEFVIKHVANEFENGGRPPNLRLCLQYRDLNEDASYHQLLETAYASRKIVILLTRNFLQSEWTRFNLRNALHEALRGKTFKLVVIEDSDIVDETDDELFHYLTSSGVQRIDRCDENFLEALKLVLTSDFVYQDTNNYTLNHSQHQSHHMTMSSRYQHQQQHLQHTPQMLTPLHKKYTHNSAGTLLDGSNIGGNDSGIVVGGGHNYHTTNYRQAPPAYWQEPVDNTANYSSATTATPSPPLTATRQQQQTIGADVVHRTLQQHQPTSQQRPLSEHIYSSIDSDYGALESENQLLQQQQQRLMYNNEHHQVSPTTWRTGN
jgi:Leucine-rich repeat (LRR) protein